MSHTSSKLIELGSTAFRQPRADSHCKYIHGYQLKAEINFACNELDNNNWVFDFGGLKDLKYIFRNQFDHTLVVAGDDPELETFKQLHEKGVVQLRIMSEGVGIERFAEWCFKTADTFVEEVTEGRVWVESVTVYEHDENFASYNRSRDPVVEKPTTEDGTKDLVKGDEQEETPDTKTTDPDPELTPAQKYSGDARVGPDVRRGNYSDPFAGTTWGNK
jgi:6-pyruvoyltetrahydropterin/6-carboxytetrahydropterin synthase